MTRDVLSELMRAGALRRLDHAFATFIASLDPHTGDPLKIAAALLARVEGMGHSCLPIDALCQADAPLFDWPPEAQPSALQLWQSLPADPAAWLAVLRASRAVWVASAATDHGQPMILDCAGPVPRLYLRRYWHYEQTVASAIRARSSLRDSVDAPALRRWITRLFEQAAPGPQAPLATKAPSGSGTTDPSAAGSRRPPDWQRIACAIAARGRLAILTGGPGTGKTHTAARLIALLAAIHPGPAPLRVALAAPTGKAAARLRQSIDHSLQALSDSLRPAMDVASLSHQIGPARTLHALLGASPHTRRFRHHAAHPIAADLVIVDEASMVHLEMMAALLQALPPSARLVLIGDKDQLASVEAGAVLGDLCGPLLAARYDRETARFIEAATGETLPSENIFQPAESSSPQASLSLFPDERAPTALTGQIIVLEQRHRFSGPIAALARAVNDAADPEQVAAHIGADDTAPVFGASRGSLSQVVALAVNGRPGARNSYRDYLTQLRARPADGDIEAHQRWVRSILEAFDRFRVLCVVREGDWGVSGLNRAIESALAAAGLLSPVGAWYAGRPVMVTRNAPAIGIFNGDVGIALPGASAADRVRVYFPHPEGVRAVSPGRLAQVETAFAATVHKSQGSEFEHTALVLAAHSGSALTRELLYTGITRARQAFTLIAEQPGLLEQGLTRMTRRESGLTGL